MPPEREDKMVVGREEGHPSNKFPKRVFTLPEVEMAKRLIEGGYKHRLTVRGSPLFRNRVKTALRLIKTARYYGFLRTYIRRIVEIDGLSQLREADATIWANRYAVADPVEAASYLIQKAQQMKNYLEGKPYFGAVGELSAVEKCIEFLEALKNRGRNQVRNRCEEILKCYDESKFL